MARLHGQTQFALSMPNFPEPQVKKILKDVEDVIKGMADSESAMPKLSVLAKEGLVFGVNALTRELQRERSDLGCIFIAQRSKQILTRHLPWLALMVDRLSKTSKCDSSAKSKSKTNSFAEAEPSVKTCSLPVSSSELGACFKLDSLAAFGIRSGSPKLLQILNLIPPTHFIDYKSFTRVSVEELLLQKRQRRNSNRSKKLPAPAGKKLSESNG